MEPTINPPNAINELQKAIMTVFPQCDDTVRRGNGTFVPHFSIGKYKNKNEMLKARKPIESNWTPVSFELKEIYLLHRLGNDPFEVKYVIPLGKNPTRPHFGPNSADDESTVAKTVVVNGLPKGVINSTQEFMNLAKDAGLSPVKGELTFNPGFKPRSFGVLEFASKQEALDACEKYAHQPYTGTTIYLRPLENMFFPDVVGGCCTVTK